MKNEIWKDLPGYENKYQVSNYGRIKSLRYNNTNVSRIMTTNAKNSKGYLVLNLSNNNVKKMYNLHQCVAMAFLGHEPNGMEIVVNHKDGNKLNNHVDNLELITNRENVIYNKKDAGVSYKAERNRWVSRILINGKSVFLGHFLDKNDALKAYKKALINLDAFDGDVQAFKELVNSYEL